MIKVICFRSASNFTVIDWKNNNRKVIYYSIKDINNSLSLLYWFYPDLTEPIEYIKIEAEEEVYTSGNVKLVEANESKWFKLTKPESVNDFGIPNTYILLEPINTYHEIIELEAFIW